MPAHNGVPRYNRRLALVFAIVPFCAAHAAPSANTIWQFSQIDGQYPVSGVTVNRAGAISGTTQSGGSATYGTVYRLTPPAAPGAAWTEQTILTLSGTDGFDPSAAPYEDRTGKLYITTKIGGGNPACVNNSGSLPAGCGSVIELTPPPIGSTSWTESVIWQFGGRDGNTPLAPLIADTHGRLYGTTALGGKQGDCFGYKCGTVFALTPPAAGGTWHQAVLYSFSGGADGSRPHAGLSMDSAGNLYGTTFQDGATLACPFTYGCGTVFRLSPPATRKGAWTQTTLWNFAGGTDGANPFGGVVLDSAGNLYGTTSVGGNTLCFQQRGCGTIFKLSPPASGTGAWTETLLYTFTGDTDFDSPQAGLLLDGAGTIWGIATDGGGTHFGGVFHLTPPPGGGAPWALQQVLSFTSTTGGYSAGNLVPGPGKADTLFGTQVYGGSVACASGAGCGSVFELSGAGFKH